MARRDYSTIFRRRIIDHVVGQIISGAWRPGERIPSEKALTTQFGVSRMTVHHALRDLAARGVVARRAGSGTFVAAPSAYVAEYPHLDIAREIADRGGLYRARILDRSERPASSADAEAFGTDPGSPLFHALILHLDGDQPIELEDRLISPRFLPDGMSLDLTEQTLFSRLMLIKPDREGSERLRAHAASASEAAALLVEPGAPLLEVVRRTWSSEGVVTVARILRTDYGAGLKGRIMNIAVRFGPPE